MSTLVWVFLVLALFAGAYVSHHITRWHLKRKFKRLIKNMVSTLLIIFNLFLIESLLSIDNAAVLAVMVKELPTSQQSKALKYGILGAFLFRGFSLFAASWLIKLLWLKTMGGTYLLYLAYHYFFKKSDSNEEEQRGNDSKIYKWGRKIGLNKLWATILLVELMDMTFSIDNIFAAVAFTQNIYFILLGVFIGIVAMRFVAQWFATLILHYPCLESSAFVVIALLGVKLLLMNLLEYMPQAKGAYSFLMGHMFDYIFSGAMLVVFFVPMMSRHIRRLRKEERIEVVTMGILMIVLILFIYFINNNII